MENDKEYFKEKIKGKAWKDEGIGRSPANFEEQKSAQKLPMKKAPSDPFGNLEEMILGKEETETRDITIDDNTDIFSSRSKAKINQEESRGDLFDKPEANLDDIIEHLTKIMKPFDKKKAEKKVPSRIKISKYLLDCKNDAVKESSDESKIKKICKYIANYSLDVYSSNLKGIHQMLYFETIEMMKNDYIELSFQNYMESNPKFDTFLNNLFSRARNFMGELQEKLNKRNDQSSDTQSSSSKDDPFTFLNKYFKSALRILSASNSESRFGRF
ncbi:unnamed protein product [Moneuplotes crassus]|uniref:Uncharacterized protein n=1 Tax=Euplotes crassus TaxID=5936 RepID=A0AAD1UPV3_EUPCR|nr:unnamed protein product [Moneuplotes crassus]